MRLADWSQTPAEARDITQLQEDCRAHIAYLIRTHDIDEHAAYVCFEEAAGVSVGAMLDFLNPPHLCMKAMRRRLRRYLDRALDRRAITDDYGG